MTPRARSLTLLATILGSAIVFIDSTVVNVALPALARDLDATLAQQQWVVESYLLMLGSLVLVGGSLGDLLGRRRIFIVGVTALCVVGVYWCFFKTSFGLKVRAVTQNRGMAAAVGISTRNVDALTFGLGTGLAGVAGCILGHMYSIKPDMGTSYVVDAFMVVILGGTGELIGTVVGGGMIGTSNSVVAKVLENEPIARVVVLLLVITFIQFRPAGMFAPKERVYD